MSDDEETQSTTFTYKPSTRRWLLETYPDAIGLNEAIRAAISDARLLRERRDVTLEDGNGDSD